ncbi:hypothetical protein NDU88_002493 [Pleurodeles waltl]|uniref:Uncharacterized protein n=1 Tax=Pleurodeles waltl TaxID=8319 RepID=A0AAV7QA32_PLEWA|nr:hypothetical protein NDU88_002493 [Pleurodeles waltl]
MDAMALQLDAMALQLDHLTEQMDRHLVRIDYAEMRSPDMEDDLTETTTQLARLQKQTPTVSIKNEDLQARSRWDNVGLVGVAENPELDCMGTQC